MFDYAITFLRPGFLLLLILAPFMWSWSYRSLSGLGGRRRFVALALRTAVLLLLVAALAEVQFVRISDRLTTIFVLDQSRSIPEAARREMTNYVNKAVAEQRQGSDRAGVIVFGKTAAIETPPFDDQLRLGESPDAMRDVDPRHTDLASAIKLAVAAFPEDAAKRIVIVSDGNENMGTALDVARGATESGVGIDVLPIEYEYSGEILVESLSLPPDVRKDQPFDLRVVLNNTAKATPAADGRIPGRLVVSATVDGATRVLNVDTDKPFDEGGQRLIVPPGKWPYRLQLELAEPNFYKFRAEFIPDAPGADQDLVDRLVENNVATAMTHVAGSARILLIEQDIGDENDEDKARRLRHESFVERMRRENLEITIREAATAFNSLEELQQYDCVVLANVPREQFSDARIAMLVRNTHDTGGGIVMLGGPESFGAGGWMNSELEQAMPVDFQIKSAKVVPKGALALIMHASEMAQGNHWQKIVAQKSIEALGGQDYCGLIHWNGSDQWLWRNGQRGMINVAPNRKMMLSRVDRMQPGDMPDFDPALNIARQEFAALTDAAVRHMIIISDGDPTPSTNAVLQGLKDQKVTVTTVAVGAHGVVGTNEMRRIASFTGGKSYEVKNPNTLPRIFQQEARRVARPLIYEPGAPFVPNIRTRGDMLKGIEGPLPPISGFVMTTLKNNPLVEVLVTSPVPGGEATEDNRTILAQWRYGLGKAVAWTTDVGQRWANDMTAWDGYDKLFSQILRSAMRPTGDTGKFTLATQLVDGQVELVVTALDQDDQFLNFQTMAATVIRPGPEAPAQLVKIEQQGPGRYVGRFRADETGGYVVTLVPGPNMPPLRAGVDVPYSDEFRVQQANTPLLEQIAALTPPESAAGKVIQNADPNGDLEGFLQDTNVFRHNLPRATSSQDAWYWALVIAAACFFADVFNRRVHVSFEWLRPLAARVWARLRGRPAPSAPSEYMSRLKSKKAEVGEQIETVRAAVRFEPTPDGPADADALSELEASGGPPRPGPGDQRGGQAMAPEAEQESYTDRLLRAKKKVWKDRRQDGGGTEGT